MGEGTPSRAVEQSRDLIPAETIVTDLRLTPAEIKEQYGLDMVTAEVILNAIRQVNAQMHTTIFRSSYSPVIRDYQDMAAVLGVIADGVFEAVHMSEGNTQHSFVQQTFVNSILDEYGLENIGPGDVVMCNDPFRGGIHGPDVCMIRVVWDEGSPVMVLSAVAHFADMGGAAPGSMVEGWAREVYQENLRIPPMLLYANDTAVRSSFNLLIENTRVPQYALGDARALYGGLVTGERLVRGLVAKYGGERVLAAARYGIDLAQRRMAFAIRGLPDGVYEGEEWADGDGIEPEPIKVKVTITVKGDRAVIDLSGSSRQAAGNTNSGCGTEASRCILGLKQWLDPASPVNAGTFKQITMLAPAGSVCNALPPAACGDTQVIGTAVYNAIYKALSRAMPHRGVACDYGTSNHYLWGGTDPRPGKLQRPWVYYLITPGGWGGTYKGDGVPFCIIAIGNCWDPVVELVEHEFPVLVVNKEFTIDSCGVGKHRGGPGTYITYEALGDVTMGSGADKTKFAPEGSAGGGPGMTNFGYLLPSAGVPTWNGITPGKFMKPLFGLVDSEGRPDPNRGAYQAAEASVGSAHFSHLRLPERAVFRNYTSAGGGYGRPWERELDAVLRDVEDELVSLNQAATLYGVVIDPATFEVDDEATVAARDRLATTYGDGRELPVAVYEQWPSETLEPQPSCLEVRARGRKERRK